MEQLVLILSSLALDPVSQFSNAFLTSNGLNIPSILELADAILECTGIDLEQIMINETVPVDFVGTPNQIISRTKSEFRLNCTKVYPSHSKRKSCH